jgi:uncharacterized protein YyaL (SSP411 family)
MEHNLSQLPEAWRLAIRREQDSHSYYKRMAQSATDASLKALFEDLASEEAKHRQLLEAAYRRLFEADLEQPKGRAGVFEHTLQAELPHAPGEAKAPPLVSWQEWGEEAFRLAQTLDVPILLSISAVWCHWCHVMDQTTFADPEVASLIAARVVPVRVDNDKRPDINARYNMGGWPTVAFLTPEGEILSGGTYMPPEAFKEALQQISDYYRDHKQEVQTRTVQIQEQRRKAQQLALQSAGELTSSITEQAYALATAAYDPQYGGFGDAPKFPQVDVIELALARHARVPPAAGQVPALDIALKTLRAMAQGGVYDHEAGGFFRYSTMRDWSVPHFEKMLEDNSRLLSTYLHAYQITDEPLFRQTAEGIVSYVESTLRDREHGYFYGSQDADQEYYALKKTERAKRQAPFVDTVCYTAWNAMMSLAYLEAAVILERPELAASALATLGFLWQHCWLPGEGLSHFWAAPAESGQDSGGAYLPGLLYDQVWMAKALLCAHEYTAEPEYLERAQQVLQWVHSALATKAGNFQDRPSSAAALGRLTEAQVSMTDNAVAAEALIHLARLGGDNQYLAWARTALSTLVTDYQRYGTLAAGYALAVEQLLSEPLQVVVVGSAEDTNRLELLRAAWRPYALNRALVAVDPIWEAERLQTLGYPAEPAPRAYVCLGHTCAEPAADVSQVVAAIRKLSLRAGLDESLG